MVIRTEEDNTGYSNELQKRVWFLWLRPRLLAELTTETGCQCDVCDVLPLGSSPSIERTIAVDDEVNALSSRDGIFHRGWVERIADGECSVELDCIPSVSVTVKLDPIFIMSIARNEDDSSDYESDRSFSQDYEDRQCDVLRPTTTAVSSSSSRVCSLATPSYSMGDWEKHTKGIGSKLLLKMVCDFY
jgi:hypothetical protein